MATSEWGFRDADDARTYLGEVGRLWAVWIAGLVFLLATNGFVILGAGVVVFVALVWMARPLQRRAERLVPEDSVVQGRRSLAGRDTTRDRALRGLVYGEEALDRAVTLAGASRLWLLGRRAVLGATVAVFVYVLLTPFGGPSA